MGEVTKYLFAEMKTKLLPALYVALTLTIAFEIGHSNIDTIKTYERFFYLPFLLSFIILKFFYTKFLIRFGSKVFIYLLLTIAFTVILPLGNRLFVFNQTSYDDIPATDLSIETGSVRKSSLLFAYFLKAGDFEVPVSRSDFQECQKVKCRISYKINEGLLGSSFVSAIEVSKP